MALIQCPECGKQISDKASSCPGCGCPIASQPKSIKVRALSDDRTVRAMVFSIKGVEVARVPIGAVATIYISEPTAIEVKENFLMLTNNNNGWFKAIPGKCYEAKWCKPKLFWTTIISEVSFIG